MDPNDEPEDDEEATQPATILVTGFPPDALPRELRNICRFFTGFEHAEPLIVQERPPQVFVSFSSQEVASEAILHLQGLALDEVAHPDLVMHAEFCEAQDGSARDAETAPGGEEGDDDAQEVGPFIGDEDGEEPPPAKRARADGAVMAPRVVPEPPRKVGPVDTNAAGGVHAAVDTLALRVENRPEETISEFFVSLPGYMALKYNPSRSNVFLKFKDHLHAQHGLARARQNGFTVEYARRSLAMDGKEVTAQAKTPTPPAPTPAPPAPARAPVPTPAPPGPVGLSDTLACKCEGRSAEEIGAFFQNMQGFVWVRFTAKGTNCFVKFTDWSWAQNGLTQARSAGYTLEFARGSGGDSGGSYGYGAPEPAGEYGPRAVARPPGIGAPPAPVHQSWSTPAEEAPSNVDTLACKVDGRAPEEIQGFFESLPGFAAIKFNSNGHNLFVKYATKTFALRALAAARQASYTIEFARSSLDSVLNSAPIVAEQPKPAAPPAPQPKPSQSGSDTLACKVEEQAAEDVQAFFQLLPGFVAIKFNTWGRNCFIKFSTAGNAHQALMSARKQGFTLEPARSSLDMSTL